MKLSPKIKIILGIVLLIGALFSANLDIDTKWHYFGNGVFFGIGLMLILNALLLKKVN